MDQERFDHLLDRYVLGEASPDERRELAALLEQPAYEELLLADMRTRYDALAADLYNTGQTGGMLPGKAAQPAADMSAAGSPDGPSPVSNRIRAKLEARLPGHRFWEPATPVRRIRFRRWVAAAALIAAVATGALLVLRPGPKPVTPPAAVADIQPGRQGAVLTLADGRTMVLDSLQQGLVATQHGTNLTLREGQLVYDAGGAATAGLNSMSVPRGRQFQLVLPDGTKVWLNSASTLRYPTAFTGSERKVSITGEAYFEVAKNAAMPFRVDVNGTAAIEVLGTRFNVNAYTDEGSIRTTLLEGSVRVNGAYVLKPGQQASITGKEVKIAEQADLEQAVAWKNGLFNFTDAEMHQVMRQLERWYDIEVEFRGNVQPREFQGKMQRSLSLSQVLEGLSEMGVHFTIEGRKLIVQP